MNKKSYHSGYRLFYRSMMDHPHVGIKKPYTKFEAWCWLLFSIWANKEKTGEIYVNNRLFFVEYGQMIYSIRYLSRAWGWGEKRARVFLKNLEKSKMLTLKVTQQMTQITICNFDTYQNRGQIEGQTEGKPRANRGQIEGTNKSTISVQHYNTDSTLSDFEQPNPTTPAEVARLFFHSWKNEKYRGDQFEKFSEMLKEELERFCLYWTEPSKNGKKERWELEKTWELSRRIKSWMNRKKTEKGSNGKYETYSQRIERENKERIEKFVNKMEKESENDFF
jgi:hypothetical protein